MTTQRLWAILFRFEFGLLASTLLVLGSTPSNFHLLEKLFFGLGLKSQPRFRWSWAQLPVTATFIFSRIIFQATPSLKKFVAGSTPTSTSFADCSDGPQL
jgi:hypothetical protein